MDRLAPCLFHLSGGKNWLWVAAGSGLGSCRSRNSVNRPCPMNSGKETAERTCIADPTRPLLGESSPCAMPVVPGDKHFASRHFSHGNDRHSA